MMLSLVSFALVGHTAASSSSPTTRPHILHILLDDWGWADAGWHRSPGYTDIQTPQMDKLLKEGVELDRHYVFKFCSPTRSAVQSGRNPIHVNVLNLEPTMFNEEDLVSGYAAVPRNMTGMAEHMLRSGYETHFYGKWDAGMATPQHTPHGRGYQKSLHYFHHTNDYWTSIARSCPSKTAKKGTQNMVDLWDHDQPAWGQNNTPSCSQDNQKGCVFEDQLFANRVMAAIEERNAEKPLFLFWAPHIVHTPLQVPQETLDRFSFIDDPERQLYHAMVYFADQAIGNVVQKLKDEGIYENTVIAIHADNGGPILNGGDGANNFPLKGGKMSNWDGGIRVNGVLSGGFLPKKVQGTKQEGLMTAWDWYATWAALAGADPTDTKAAAAGLPPIDSINMWPLLSGETDISPREELEIGDLTATDKQDGKTKTLVGGLIKNNYKLLIGNLSMACWTGPKSPNTTIPDNGCMADYVYCGNTTETGCLYDIMNDPSEYKNIANQAPMKDTFNTMYERILELQKGVFSPDRGVEDPRACHLAQTKYKGFWGPFIDVDLPSAEDEQIVI